MKTNSEKMEKTGSAGRSDCMAAESKASSVKTAAAKKCAEPKGKPEVKKSASATTKKSRTGEVSEPKSVRR